MTFKDFFMRQPWWGKLIGALFGYLTAGSVGAVFGILAGNFFDKGLAQHFLRPYWTLHAEKNKQVQQLFFKATFIAMGYIAKSSGRVSETDIEMARAIMAEMRLKGEQSALAKQYYREGKSKSTPLSALLIELKKACYYKPILLNLFVDIQYRAAFTHGFTPEKMNAFNQILSDLNFAELNKQYRFYEDFGQQTTHKASQQSTEGPSYHRPSRPYQASDRLAQAYTLLNLTPNATHQEVKKAYRRLMSKHHPDKLIAQGLPASMIKMANEKTQAISKAYEEICATKGW